MPRKSTSFLLIVLLIFFSCQDQSDDEARQSGTSAEIPPELIEKIITPFNRGVALMEQYRPVEAVEAFEEVVTLVPKWSTGRLNLGIAYLNTQREEDYPRAEEELKRVIDQDPNNPYAHYALGMLFKHLARLDEATAQFEAVLEIDPDDADANYQLGSLLMENDAEAARYHLEKTLEAVPHHESACYRLQQVLRKLGEKEKAQELLLRFQALKRAEVGVFSGMKYGEMGRYADVIRIFEDPVENPESNIVPQYHDIAEEAGLRLTANRRAGWPAETGEGQKNFAPGIAAAEIDDNGELAVFITGVGQNRTGALYRHNGVKFSLVRETGIDARNAIGAYFGDYDRDGDPDLYLTCDGPNKLYRNEGQLHFKDVTAESGTSGGSFLSVGAAWADTDHDGDLDLYVANFSASTGSKQGSIAAKNNLFRNNGDGSFIDVASDADIDGGDAATVSVLFFDFDDDLDLDLFLINQQAENRLFLNNRIGHYSDASSSFQEFKDDSTGLGALTGDLDSNAREDIVLLRGSAPPRLFLQVERGRYTEDNAFAAQAQQMGGAVSGVVSDVDLDGDFDLVFFGAGAGSSFRHQILMNKGAARFEQPVPFGPEHAEPAARGAIATDLDEDGGPELMVGQVDGRPQLWRAEPPESRHWLQVIPVDSRQSATSVTPVVDGLRVEIKSGRDVQVASIRTSTGYLASAPRRALFGLGRHAKTDYVRLTWPDAVIQSELEISADQTWRIKKVERKPSSCPVLFSWDGKRFSFITDFLGVGGVGFFISPGEYGPPDPTEDVRIPPESVKPHKGRYLLRIAEPLEEVTYLDQLHLIAYDHPGHLELYPDERFTGTAPFPTGAPYLVADKIYPRAAITDRGENVLSRLLDIDRRYVEPPHDRRFIGYADDHWLELDFGDQLQHLDSDAGLVLYLYGWVEYTYSHINYAAHQAGLAMRSPSIEVPDGNGGWDAAVEELGYPAGLPRMMTFDISALPVRENGRFRIRTNMEVFWDQIFIGEKAGDGQLKKSVLQPSVAGLRHLGYPREFSPDGANPTLYDYHRIDHGVSFKNMTGDFTKFGDVRALLKKVDDQFVIMARGDEIALEFEATKLPALPEGWQRTLVLHTDGFCKDMNLYTAFPNTVEPLPYHTMENYPPGTSIFGTKELHRYQAAWNTRRISGDR